MAEVQEILDMALELGRSMMNLADAAIILEVDIAELKDQNTVIGKNYLKGKMMAKMDLHKIIIRQALAGSKPAQDLVNSMIDKLNMDGDS